MDEDSDSDYTSFHEMGLDDRILKVRFSLEFFCTDLYIYGRLERKIAKNIKKDSKSFFKYVRSKIRVKTTVGPLLDDNDVLVCDDNEMGEMLNTFFASVFTLECQDNLPSAKKMFHGSNSEKLVHLLSVRIWSGRN